jgi:hypothetical protein
MLIVRILVGVQVCHSLDSFNQGAFIFWTSPVWLLKQLLPPGLETLRLNDRDIEASTSLHWFYLRKDEITYKVL